MRVHSVRLYRELRSEVPEGIDVLMWWHGERDPKGIRAILVFKDEKLRKRVRTCRAEGALRFAPGKVPGLLDCESLAAYFFVGEETPKKQPSDVAAQVLKYLEDFPTQ